jgi:hypothetical protein
MAYTDGGAACAIVVAAKTLQRTRLSNRTFKEYRWFIFPDLSTHYSF